MPSQLDLDQGGTPREWGTVYLGPSVGWVRAPVRNQFPITSGGTFLLDPSTSYVPVNTTGAVTITLPSAFNPASAQAQPGLFVNNAIIVVDIGGNAVAHPITIQAKSGETVMGVASIQITTNWGGYYLVPNPATLTWNST